MPRATTAWWNTQLLRANLYGAINITYQLHFSSSSPCLAHLPSEVGAPPQQGQCEVSRCCWRRVTWRSDSNRGKPQAALINYSFLWRYGRIGKTCWAHINIEIGHIITIHILFISIIFFKENHFIFLSISKMCRYNEDNIRPWKFQRCATVNKSTYRD